MEDRKGKLAQERAEKLNAQRIVHPERDYG